MKKSLCDKEKIKGLGLDPEKLEIYNVNRSVIECYKGCKPIEIDEDLPEELTKYIEECRCEYDSNNYKECIDLLGVYVSLVDDDQSNILMSKEKIGEVAKKYGIGNEAFYDFVCAHELAHAKMCPKLSERKEFKVDPKKKLLYAFIEESLANAFALKIFKDHECYLNIVKFVEAQPPRYRYSLELLKMYKEVGAVEKLMSLWLTAKLNRGVDEYDFKEKEYGPFIYWMHLCTGNVDMLPQTAIDAFIF